MRSDIKVRELIGEIDKTILLLKKIKGYYSSFVEKELPLLGKKQTSGIVFAEIFVDYYTCVETLFFRISQTFENHLSKERWHSDLLRKMAIDVEGVRRKVIRTETENLLDEFLKFRHFRRYYFSMEYDWDKLQYLEKKYMESEQKLLDDLNYSENL
jgi:hypothetical protein